MYLFVTHFLIGKKRIIAQLIKIQHHQNVGSTLTSQDTIAIFFSKNKTKKKKNEIKKRKKEKKKEREQKGKELMCPKSIWHHKGREEV